MIKQKYKTKKITRFWIELYGWIFIITLFGAIWISDYRWQLFFTSLVCIIFAIILTYTEIERKKKFNIKNLNKQGGQKNG